MTDGHAAGGSATAPDPPVRVQVVTEVDAVQTAQVHRLYDEVFADQPDPRAWEAMWRRHVSRPGFRLALAHDTAARLTGFAYGYTGEAGQWWTDQARAALPEAVGSAWLGGHFEVVSLAVDPAVRGRGTGRALMGALLDGLPHDRAVLMTEDDPEAPAYRLYRSDGWAVLGGGIRPGTVVMGLRRGAGAAG